MMSPADMAASLQAASSKATPKPSAARGDVAGARKTAEDFATFFFSQSLESVFSNMGSDKMFGGGSGEDVYRSLLTQEYGKIIWDEVRSSPIRLGDLRLARG